MSRNANAASLTEPKGLQSDLAAYGVETTHSPNTQRAKGIGDNNQTQLSDYNE